MKLQPYVVEAKVLAAAAGSGAGAAVAGLILWLLGVLVWHAPDTAAAATDAVARVPGPVSAVILLFISAIGAVLAGYRAPHTARSKPLELQDTSTPIGDSVAASLKE